MTIELSPIDRPECWRGAAEWTEADGWWRAWRLPRRSLVRCAAPLLTARATIPNGCRVEVDTDAVAVELDLLNEATGPDGFVDVVVDGVVLDTVTVHAGASRLRTELGPGRHQLELWLPHDALVQFGPLRLLGASFADAAPMGTASLLTYGSSLTLSGASRGPASTWPAAIARESGWALTNLAMPGECHIDPPIARHIAQTAADLIFICPGVNVYGAGSFTERTLVPAITGFLETVRDGHNRTPIVVMTPIALDAHEQVENLVGLTLARVRELVAASAQILIDEGDEQITVVDGRTILASDEQYLLSDGIHPVAAGYELMGRRLGPVLRNVLAAAGSIAAR